MTAQILTQDDINILRSFVNMDSHEGRVSYYQYLADRGYEYANMALGVVENNTIPGITARNYAEIVGSHAGVTLADSDWNNFSQNLMAADFSERESAFMENPNNPPLLDWTIIQDYHAQVFDFYGLPPEDWTPNTALNSSRDPDTTWDNLVSNGGVNPIASLLCFPISDRRRLESSGSDDGDGLVAPPGMCRSIGTLYPIALWCLTSL